MITKKENNSKAKNEIIKYLLFYIQHDYRYILYRYILSKVKKKTRRSIKAPPKKRKTNLTAKTIKF